MDSPRRWDAIVIGSGFGGVMAAYPLVEAGLSVVMLERGEWVHRGPENWSAGGAGLLTPHYSTQVPYRVRDGRHERPLGAFFCVGGPSVFYGGASLRFRETDFRPPPSVVGGSGASWPIRYPDLEPWYGLAEELLGVVGEAGIDPTEPFRSKAYPDRATRLAPFSAGLARAAMDLGLHPFPLPLAINHAGADHRPACVRCGTCDGFACAIGAKNDLASGLIPTLIRSGLTLWPNAVTTRIVERRARVIGVECVDRVSRRRFRVRADRVIVAAGAVATPQLLLGSGLARFNSAGHLVGHFLTRHLNTAVFGLFPRRPNPMDEFVKQVAIHDYYSGDPAGGAARGGIQQLSPPPLRVVATQIPRVLLPLASMVLSRLGGLLTIVEDQPQHGNRMELLPERPDLFGLPSVIVHHRYSTRDLALARALTRRARAILAGAGALLFHDHRIETLSHALGTVRMGIDPKSAPLDAAGRFRGVEGLWVSDGSTLPTSAAVNPSLTIAANALRIGSGIAGVALDREISREGELHAHHHIA